MTHFASSAAPLPSGHGRSLLDPQATLQDVLDSLLGRLDAVQRRAFHEKMMQLDGARPRQSSSGPARGLATETAPARPSPWLC